MTTREARRVADLRWGTEHTGIHGRRGIATLMKATSRKPAKCLVGYYSQAHGEMLMGSGPTWEAAFADAATRTQP